MGGLHHERVATDFAIVLVGERGQLRLEDFASTVVPERREVPRLRGSDGGVSPSLIRNCPELIEDFAAVFGALMYNLWVAVCWQSGVLNYHPTGCHRLRKDAVQSSISIRKCLSKCLK